MGLGGMGRSVGGKVTTSCERRTTRESRQAAMPSSTCSSAVPSLILIDELLEYLISSGGVRVEQNHTAGRNAVVPQTADGGSGQCGQCRAGVLIAIEQA